MQRTPYFDRVALVLLLAGGLALAARAWFVDHPQHNPWAPLDLHDPPGWATNRKIAAVRADPATCLAALERSGVDFVKLPAAGDGACRRTDRLVLNAAPLAPSSPPITCAVGVGFELWLRQGVQPAAERILGERVERIEHFGAYNCRRLYGRDAGQWSEHASGNALDVAAFVLADGRRITVADDWTGAGDRARFLNSARDAACDVFGTVLSPDYNAAHADHLHLDQARRGFGGACR